MARTSSSFNHAGEELVLRADGTWQRRRNGQVVARGGEPTDLPGPADLEHLNWLGPGAAADCLGSVDARCPEPVFEKPWGGELVYVPTTTRRTTNKGDFETGGDYFAVTRRGRVLVDENGVHWVRRSTS